MHYFAGDYDVGLVSRVCDIPPTVASSEDMDRPFDILAASVDGLCVLLDIQKLDRADRSVADEWNNFYLDSDSISSHVNSQAETARLSVLRIAEENPSVIQHAAVEIKTPTTPETVARATRDLTKARSILDTTSRTVLFKVPYNSGAYRALVTSEHRLHLRHHASILGLCHAMYV